MMCTELLCQGIHPHPGPQDEVPAPELLTLHLRTLGGDTVGTVHIHDDVTARDLAERVAEVDGTPTALVLLLWGSQHLNARLSLREVGMPSGATVEVVRLSVPDRYDTLEACDGCDFLRYCHYGYARRDGSEDYEK